MKLRGISKTKPEVCKLFAFDKLGFYVFVMKRGLKGLGTGNSVVNTINSKSRLGRNTLVIIVTVESKYTVTSGVSVVCQRD
jgi:hypothetical protein